MSQEVIYQILKTATHWDSDEDVWNTTYEILDAIRTNPVQPPTVDLPLERQNPITDLERAVQAIKSHKPFEHPQYIDGYLYVTQEQHAALLAYGDDRPFADRPLLAISGIPVLILKPGKSVQRKDGSSLFVTLDGDMYSTNRPTPYHLAYLPITHRYADAQPRPVGTIHPDAYFSSPVN